MGSVNIAFRAQLVVPEQRQLYDYWLSCGGGKPMPCRSDINPADIPRLLPFVSLIEVAEDVKQSRVRLAGTRLRDVFDREITGLTIDDLDLGAILAAPRPEPGERAFRRVEAGHGLRAFLRARRTVGGEALGRAGSMLHDLGPPGVGPGYRKQIRRNQYLFSVCFPETFSWPLSGEIGLPFVVFKA